MGVLGMTMRLLFVVSAALLHAFPVGEQVWGERFQAFE